MGRRRKPKPKIYELEIESLSHEGRGIAHLDEKVIFVSGALPGEKVVAERVFSRAKFEEAAVVEVLKPAENRIVPKCEVFGVCGGCSFQHLSSEDQIEAKGEWLKDAFKQQAKIEPKNWLEPLQVQAWGYRRKARLGVRWVAKKDKVLVGFREKKSGWIANMDRCEVLHASIGEHLRDLGECIERLSIKSQVPQIEVAIAENNTVLILRHLEPFSAEDEQILLDCANKLGVSFYTQSGGEETVKPLGESVVLTYSHPNHNIEMAFLPTDFTQVNFKLNQKMVSLALDLLALDKSDKVIDLFCGLGNFTLPIARYVQYVVGVEGDSGLIERAKANAVQNGIQNADFYKADLFKEVAGFEWFRDKTYNKALIDPARSGAIEIIELLPKLGVERLVYVSCNPATLARDTEKLIEIGYKLETAGVMDMFPQTAHIESIALFIKC
ncbi:23S rRNA (uracil(1939)-C(5))-methyltransferase (EC 2.1.1.190) [uncultured Gammaproteobacteria bacterium]|jgi:23S rRNA (uracil1939-C5)-methyltransferase|nr:23S rRNA (uracil(1939)-C(5))-methyltransferase (EC 2.1.1.190) [uncultured Gammaproteobacteria bacterium]CAC9566910.1 23S rRNA (uracil(1939)-C(5))-methyltransferase (EC 2.1.1.190) [uncultured Gammaproteobacteria bacterium]CAC9585560.1 23S rRNA (uracil(1939)-C(5))-methyltransferase (EC 2.1.1.190) [uncultured Gammaproteobacteria bacterium]CAC9590503.1 23S rRNA (uracil(1939)-C(5))-methyltransferase (EC 2.1.1.190) [uncultured Gammaproteobacteria bacterium]